MGYERAFVVFVPAAFLVGAFLATFFLVVRFGSGSGAADATTLDLIESRPR
ncbi:MAG: hypothetical protein IT377_24405, partial [Polyangiaceae bacterium]|nr:hypothetical protein [Polyangiaceae bacterium]